MKNNTATANINVESIDRLCIVSVVTERYECMESGKNWQSKPYQREEKEVDGQFYHNSVAAIPVFRSLGGKERVTMGYTFAGYIPVELTSVSPDGAEKVVRRFTFTPRT